jgi:alpha-N-arabinofuranosidase
VHHDATYLPIELETPDYTFRDEAIPAVSASASRDEDGSVHISLVNLDPKAEAVVTASIAGPALSRVSGTILAGDALDAHNTVETPERVKPAAFDGATLDGSTLEARLPAASVVVLTLSAGS